MKRLGKIILILLLLGVVFSISSFYLLKLPRVQLFLTGIVTSYLSKELNTTVSVESVHFRFFNRILLGGIYIEDHNQDTLLYAGNIDVKIRLRSLLNKKVRIKDADISDVYVYLHRPVTSERFNYEFITDKFSIKEKKPDEPAAVFHLDMKAAALRNIRFHYLDQLGRNEYKATLEYFNATGFSFNTSENHLYADALNIDGINLSIAKLCHFDICIPEPSKPYAYAAQQKLNDKETEQTGAPFSASLKHFTLNKSSFSYDNYNKPPDCIGIDFNHVLAYSIRADMNELLFRGDSLTTHINKISASETSGFTLNNLTSDFLFTSNIMEFKNMEIITPESHITDYFSMSYDNFTDFGDFLNNVTMRGNLNRAKVALRDINYFAKALGFIEHNTVLLTGNVYGTVSHLRGRNLVIDAGKLTRFNGRIDLTGLPNIEETFFSLKLDKVRTEYRDLQNFIPSVKFPKQLEQLGLVRISGNFDGFINDFVANAEMMTQVGLIRSDINFKFADDIEEAAYAGHLATVEFNLGKWLQQENLFGRITMNGKVNGKGLTLETIDTDIDGTIHSIWLNKYDYTGIRLEGEFAEKMFSGMATVNDPNLVLDFNGVIDLADTALPKFSFKSNVKKSNLHELKLMNDTMTLTARLDMDFSGIKPDDIQGIIDISDLEIERYGNEYSMNNLYLSSFTAPNQSKKIKFDSDIGTIDMEGKIKFEEFYKSLQYFFQNYFTNTAIEFSEAEAKKYQQEFTLDINIPHTSNLTELLHPKFKKIDSIRLSGLFSTDKNLLQLNGHIKGITYNKETLENISIDINGSPRSIRWDTKIAALYYNDSLFTENISLNTSLERDSAVLHFTIQDSASPNRVDFHASIQSDLKTISASVLPSAFYFNHQPWVIDKENSIFYDGKILDIRNLEVARDKHKIEVRTNIDPDSNTHLVALLSNVLLDEITQAIPPLKPYKINGIANGNLTILNVLKAPGIMASLYINNLSIDGVDMGNFSANSKYNYMMDHIDFSGSLTGAMNNMTFKGNYIAAKGKEDMDIDVDVGNLKLDFLEKLLKNALNNTSGNVSGKLLLTGNFDKPVLTGKLLVKDIQTTLDFLNMPLSVKNEEITFSKNLIALGNMTLYDRLGNKAEATGRITHDFFQKFRFDISARTDLFEFMNTSVIDNSQFFGRALGSGKIFITGLLNDLNLNIEAVTKRNTKVSISVVDNKEVSQYTFYRIVDLRAAPEVREKVYAREVSGININLNLSITPEAEVELVLSGNQGDVISGKGEGNLKIGYDKYGELSIIGNFNVIEGEYLFTMQNVISKKFQLERGSQILWAGNPYDAKMSINAVYRLRASPYDLIEDVVKSNSEKLAQARNRVMVYLYLKIQGSLLDPEISFDIKIPDADPAIKSALDSKLDMIRIEQNELNKQVVGLLVLNKFLPVYSLGSLNPDNYNLASGATNTVSEFLSNQLSLYLSDWLSKFVTDVQLDINYRTYQTNIGGQTASEYESEMLNRRELQLALTKSFLNDRILVDVGGNFDFSGQQEQSGSDQRGSNIAGDFEVQYALTSDGRYRVKAFRRGEYDIFSERNRSKTGMAIQYKKEFDNWKDLTQQVRERFRRKNKKEDVVDPPAKQYEFMDEINDDTIEFEKKQNGIN